MRMNVVYGCELNTAKPLQLTGLNEVDQTLDQLVNNTACKNNSISPKTGKELSYSCMCLEQGGYTKATWEGCGFML